GSYRLPNPCGLRSAPSNSDWFRGLGDALDHRRRFCSEAVAVGIEQDSVRDEPAGRRDHLAEIGSGFRESDRPVANRRADIDVVYYVAPVYGRQLHLVEVELFLAVK